MRVVQNLIIVVMMVSFFACDASKTVDSKKVLPIEFNESMFKNLAGPHTRVVFNQPVDLRYAWLGNDAQQVDFEEEIINLINSATTTIDVATMTFTKGNIAQALADKANAGVQVRIIGDSPRRSSIGFWKSQTGNLSIIDNNLPALLYKINFQNDVGAPPAGWFADRGEIFGNHAGINNGEVNFGWSVSQTPYVASGNIFASPLLDDFFARPNSDGSHTWEIEVPSGYYYVHAMVGQPQNSYHPRNNILVEGQTIFRHGSGYTRWLATNSEPDGKDLFEGSVVDGGSDPDNGVSNARRILVTDGRLTVTVGKSDDSSWSSLCYLEIYKGDGDVQGDDHYEDGMDNTVQDRQTHHAKYIIVDGGTPQSTLWVSSGNLTGAMDGMSEDTIISTDSDLSNLFLDQFNQMWGSSSGEADSNNSNFGTYKSVTPGLDLIIDGFDWTVRFSPSIDGTYDMGAVVNDMVGGAQGDLVLIMEQFTNSTPGRGVVGAGSILNTTIPGLLSDPDFDLFAIVGGHNFVTNPWTAYENAHVSYSAFQDPVPIHNKYALSNVLNDSRIRLNGKVLCGSMNWSQSAMHYNDEQTFIIENPYIANQYFQHAMSRLQEKGIAPDKRTDIVLIIDRSTSMNGLCLDGTTPKIDAATSAANLFLDIIEDDSQHNVSVIRFGQEIELFDPPIILEPFSSQKRAIIKDQVASIVADAPIGNATSYGIPLAEAAAQLTGITQPNERQIVHLFTDGRENRSPYASSVYSELSDRGVEIHSTGFGIDARTDILNQMANSSGGTYAQVELDDASLKKRFAQVARDAMSLDTILDPMYELKPDGKIEQTLYIDSSAKNIKFIFTWNSKDKGDLKPSLMAPDGTLITKSIPGVTFKSSPGYTVICVSPTQKSTFKTKGFWNISMHANKLLSQNSLKVDLMVLADTDFDFKAQIIPGKKPNTVLLLARMLKSTKPVVNGNQGAIHLKASVGMPLIDDQTLREKRQISLFDDGKHGDGKANDGLFGASFALPVKGDYTFHINSYFSDNKASDKKIVVTREAMVNYSWGLEKQEFSKLKD